MRLQFKNLMLDGDIVTCFFLALEQILFSLFVARLNKVLHGTAVGGQLVDGRSELVNAHESPHHCDLINNLMK